jgi:hypothetical protein
MSTSINGLVASVSGPPFCRIPLHYSHEINIEHRLGVATTANPASATLVYAPDVIHFHTSISVTPFRHLCRAAVLDGLTVTLHAGPRALGITMDVAAYWCPSGATTFTDLSQIESIFRVHRFTIGNAQAVPPAGYPIPLPPSIELPLWSIFNTPYPELRLYVTHHPLTTPNVPSHGHFLRLEVTGGVQLIGGF